MDKRGQVAIFVVVAIVIVVAGILVYLFVPQVSDVIRGELNPNSFLAGCVEDEVKQGIELLSRQGGYANPEGYILYKGNKLKYLCYNAQYYLPCKVQQPLIKAHFEKELDDIVESKTNECVENLVQEYQRRGYEVSEFSGSTSKVEIIPSIVRINVEAPLTVTRDTTQSYAGFEIDIPSKMYDLLMISTSIIDYESTYGDSETTLYMRYYPNLRIEKMKLGDGSTAYKVSDVVSGESFSFASRSVAWPPGYGTGA